MRDQDKFRGCLIGGAAGDALGYAVEFLGENSIFSRYGKEGITEYELDNGEALISDDTQMTLFTAAGLLAGAGAGSAGSYSEAFHTAYVDWLKTQEERYPIPESSTSSWLMKVPGLYSRRAPGNTCLGALSSGHCGTLAEPINHSKGCGGVMRAAPAGLFFNDRRADVKDIARIGAEAAAVTHGHPLGWMPGAVLAQTVHEISQNGENVRDAVLHSLDTVTELWPEAIGREFFVKLIRRAVELASEETDDLEAIHELGEGWVGDEALAIAVYCAVKYEDDFDKALIVSVNHRGDSDSTGAVLGNILGARIGYSGIPEKYTENLELKDVILDTADRLWNG